jgi:hypothetical protein
MGRFRSICIAVLVAVLAGAGCHNTPTTPSVTTTATTIVFASRIQIGGAAWRSFTQTSLSIVTARLALLSPDSAVTMRIGFGTFDGNTCTTTITADAVVSDTDPQLSSLLTPGQYCIQIWDVGNLTKINDFAIFVVQP